MKSKDVRKTIGDGMMAKCAILLFFMFFSGHCFASVDLYYEEVNGSPGKCVACGKYSSGQVSCDWTKTVDCPKENIEPPPSAPLAKDSTFIIDPFPPAPDADPQRIKPPSIKTIGLYTPTLTDSTGNPVKPEDITQPCPASIDVRCPNINNETPNSSPNCPHICYVERKLISANNKEPFSSYSEAVCPLQYIQLTTFSEGPAVVKKSASKRPFPIPDIDTFNSYKQKNYSCELLPTVYTKPTPTCLFGDEGHGYSVDISFNRETPTNLDFQGQNAIGLYIGFANHKNPNNSYEYLNWISYYYKNNACTELSFNKDGKWAAINSNITYPENINGKYLNNNIFNTAKFEFFTPVYYQYKLYSCTKLEGYYYEPDQTVNTKAICSHPSLQWYKDGKIMNPIDPGISSKSGGNTGGNNGGTAGGININTGGNSSSGGNSGNTNIQGCTAEQLQYDTEGDCNRTNEELSKKYGGGNYENYNYGGYW